LFFRRKREPVEDRWRKRVEVLESRIGELLDLQTEMTSIVDKLFAMEGRWRKRDRDEARRADVPAPNGPAAEPLNPMALRLLARGEKH
jgi:hypothetical protein